MPAEKEQSTSAQQGDAHAGNADFCKARVPTRDTQAGPTERASSSPGHSVRPTCQAEPAAIASAGNGAKLSGSKCARGVRPPAQTSESAGAQGGVIFGLRAEPNDIWQPNEDQTSANSPRVQSEIDCHAKSGLHGGVKSNSTGGAF